uniref:Galectin n=1 Tax=Sinocyclocheilus rhinocerous TaxID=307959 RepID=A0A673KEJ6_9TELE
MSFTFKSSIPYVSRISGGLKAGKAIFIQGSVPSGCESFVVNLKCGESEGDDIAFQIKPQFSSDRMVLNSRQHGSWGKEEKLELPLKQASGFDLIIAVNSENYQVEVGRFQHRISLDRVIALSVGGEVSVTNVAFTEVSDKPLLHIFSDCINAAKNDILPYIKPRPPPATYNPPNALFTMQSIPYVSRISGGLKAGKAIFIQGSVPSLLHVVFDHCSFVVNLKCGESEGDDIAFQIKPQFSSDRMVLNSRQHGSWGKEEKLELPLKQASGFDLIIAVNSENYQVEVGRFQHRISLDRVIALSVGGEVSVTNVAFTEVSDKPLLHIFSDCINAAKNDILP